MLLVGTRLQRVRAGTNKGTVMGKKKWVRFGVWATLLCAIGSARATMPLQVSYEDSFGLASPVQANWGTGSGTYYSVLLDLKQFHPDLASLHKIHSDHQSSA